MAALSILADPWLAALIALLPAVALGVLQVMRGPPASRIVALQLATALAAPALVLATFAFDQASSIDLALTLGLLSYPGSLLFAVFLERWL